MAHERRGGATSTPQPQRQMNRPAGPRAVDLAGQGGSGRRFDFFAGLAGTGVIGGTALAAGASFATDFAFVGDFDFAVTTAVMGDGRRQGGGGGSRRRNRPAMGNSWEANEHHDAERPTRDVEFRNPARGSRPAIRDAARPHFGAAGADSTLAFRCFR